MRKIVHMNQVSLDGFFEGPDHDISWHLVDEELHSHMNEVLGAAGGFLAGRVTYELMAAYWPTADEAPDATDIEREFAAIWRETPKVVYSRTLEQAGWNTTIVREVDAKEVRALKEQPGGDLFLSGHDVAAELAAQDLIDEYRVYVQPVLIGRGRSPFPDRDARTALTPAETRRFGNGVTLLRYEVKRS